MRTIFYPVLLLFFSSLTAAAQTDRSERLDNCPGFRVTATSQQEVNSATFQVTFMTEGGKAPYRYIFYDNTGNLVSEAFSAGTYKNVLKGDYQCLAVDSGQCRQLLTLSLK